MAADRDAPFDVLGDVEYVVQHSTHVRVRQDRAADAARKVAAAMKENAYSPATWKQPAMHPKEATEATAEWIFVVDLLNFSFWLDGFPDRSFAVHWRGERHRGYFGLCACINRALAEGIPVTTASYVATAPVDQLRAVFRSDAEDEPPIPLLEERVASWQAAARELVAHWNGRFADVVRAARGSAQRLMRLVLAAFPTFRDVHEYRGRRVHILKRAQILVADLWACFEGQGLGAFADIDAITMFADYRVPQTLLQLELLEYSPELMQRLTSSLSAVLASGEPAEVELRAASIWAVELLRRAWPPEVSAPPLAILIDFYLWDYAIAHRDQIQNCPIHRTRTIYY